MFRSLSLTILLALLIAAPIYANQRSLDEASSRGKKIYTKSEYRWKAESMNKNLGAGEDEYPSSDQSDTKLEDLLTEASQGEGNKDKKIYTRSEYKWNAQNMANNMAARTTESNEDYQTDESQVTLEDLLKKVSAGADQAAANTGKSRSGDSSETQKALQDIMKNLAKQSTDSTQSNESTGTDSSSGSNRGKKIYTKSQYRLSPSSFGIKSDPQSTETPEASDDTDDATEKAMQDLLKKLAADSESGSTETNDGSDVVDLSQSELANNQYRGKKNYERSEFRYSPENIGKSKTNSGPDVNNPAAKYQPQQQTTTSTPATTPSSVDTTTTETPKNTIPTRISWHSSVATPTPTNPNSKTSGARNPGAETEKSKVPSRSDFNTIGLKANNPQTTTHSNLRPTQQTQENKNTETAANNQVTLEEKYSGSAGVGFLFLILTIGVGVFLGVKYGGALMTSFTNLRSNQPPEIKKKRVRAPSLGASPTHISTNRMTTEEPSPLLVTSPANQSF